MTKVSITMELDEVLSHVEMLMRKDYDLLANECTSQLRQALETIEKAKNDNGDARHALIFLDQCRLNLAKLDEKLEKRSQIIQGFHLEDSNNELKDAVPELESIKRAVDELKESTE
jgi:prefoldin subunit 5